MSPLVFVFIIVFLASSPLATSTTHNVLNFRAKPNGRTDSTKDFLLFENKSIALPSLPSYGTIIAPSDYHVIGNSENWLLFENVHGVLISSGILDGQGTSLWNCKASARNALVKQRAATLHVPSGSFLVKPIVFNGPCKNKILFWSDGKILVPTNYWSFGSSGFWILFYQVSRVILDARGGAFGLAGMLERFVRLVLGVGSLAEHTHEDGVQNVTLTSAVFIGTQNGVRIKSWGRPSSGFANIVFQNIIMKNAYNPIIIDQKYCPSGHGCPNQNSGVKISGVTYKNIRGTS
ncbi:hypothetical protein GH714_030912 [Hevea brasiliensis]|uniref:Pectate lyase superfamily protein domain-containing protein n=1 Tax=Hevea brasiliensis TaxID=3981 RepID=A0A6A6NKJ6_HEVBR|nr:hypothetical protein GH714_030912 [Hevea brasiliensis]